MAFVGDKMDKSYLVYDALRVAFGYYGIYGIPFKTQDDVKYEGANDFDQVEYSENSVVSGADLRHYVGNGNYYLCPVKFKEIDSNNTYVVPNAMVSVRAAKKLIETPMVDAGGSVIEEIGTDNYAFTIRGVIVSEEEVPVEDIRNLVGWFKTNKEVSMSNALSDILMDEDDTIIIKEIILPDMEGISNAQSFQIEAISNKPFILEL